LPEVSVAFTVTTTEDVTVCVITTVESCSVVEGRVEFVQCTEEIPMGSALSTVVTAVPVTVGREMRLVWFQPRELETLPGAVSSVHECTGHWRWWWH
jgi:hypothetical protein